MRDDGDFFKSTRVKPQVSALYNFVPLTIEKFISFLVIKSL